MYVLTYLDKNNNIYKNILIEADSKKQAIIKTEKILKPLGIFGYDDPFLSDKEVQIKL